MNSDFINKQLDLITENDQWETPLNYAMGSSWLMANFKGHDLKIYKTDSQNSLAEYFIIGSFQNAIQMKSLSDAFEKYFKKFSLNLLSVEGAHAESDWVLIDFADIIVHLFQETARDVYNLDELWSSYKSIEIPEEFYFSTPEAATVPTTPASRNYF